MCCGLVLHIIVMADHNVLGIFHLHDFINKAAILLIHFNIAGKYWHH